MVRMIRQSLVAYATPLCETIVEAPQPRGTEVLVRISRCGVCHSDVHLQDGYFALTYLPNPRLKIEAWAEVYEDRTNEIPGVNRVTWSMRAPAPHAAKRQAPTLSCFPNSSSLAIRPKTWC